MSGQKSQTRSSRADATLGSLFALLWPVAFFGFTFWPGFLDGDGFSLLWQARNNYYEDFNPLSMAVIWRVLILIFDHSGSMLIAQSLLVGVAVFSVVRTFRLSWPVVFAMVTMLFLLPPVAGYGGSIVKDVWFGAFAMVAMVFVSGILQGSNDIRPWLGFGLASGAALLFRHNGITFLFPVFCLVFWSLVRSFGLRKLLSRDALPVGIQLGLAVAFALGIPWVAKRAITSHYEVRHAYPMQWIGLYELAAISCYSDTMWVPEPFRNGETLESIKEKFDPTSNMSLLAFRESGPSGLVFCWNDADHALLMRTWRRAICSEPGAYLLHRTHMSLACLGVVPSTPFIYQPGGLGSNPFGHGPFVWNSWRGGFFSWMDAWERSPFNRLWPYLILELVTVYGARRFLGREHRAYLLSLACFVGTLGYVLGFFATAPAVGFRYWWPLAFMSFLNLMVVARFVWLQRKSPYTSVEA